MAFGLIPALVMAAGYGGAEGRNQLGELIYIAADNGDELYIIKGPGDGTWSDPYSMKAECPQFAAAMSTGSDTFSCPPGRKFPLSGATYRIGTSRTYRPCNTAPFYDKTPGAVYRCIKGCENKSAPALFRERPWEC
jgi:hypothetical protein